MPRFFLATNDVESTSISFNKQREATAEKVLHEGMPALLDLYRHYNIRATFFFTGEIAEQYPELVRMIIPDKHEVACHGYSHADEYAFDKLGYHDQLNHLRKAKAILEDIAGTRVISFRSPALRVNEFTPQALQEAGFEIDSSISSQRADSIFSFGTMQKMNRLAAPRKPYFTSNHNLARRGKSGIYEIPVSAFAIPYLGTFMRISPFVTRRLRNLLNWEAHRTQKPVVFLIHPNECFVEQDNDIAARRSSNPVKYLLAEKLRTSLKRKNLGAATIDLYREQLNYFVEKDYSFCTLTQYRNGAIQKQEDQ